MTHITGPGINGTLRPKGMPPRFYYVQQEKEACKSHSENSSSSPTLPSSSSSCSPNGEPNAADAPAWKRGCRVVKMKRDGYSVYSPSGYCWLMDDRTWLDAGSLHMSLATHGNFANQDIAESTLAACTVPPPDALGTKEETCSTSTHSSQDSRLESSSQTSPPGAPRPRLRDAGEVARGIWSPVRADYRKVVTADRVAVLEMVKEDVRRLWGNHSMLAIIDRRISEMKDTQ